MSSDTSALVIGTSGALGKALVSELIASGRFSRVHAASRQAPRLELEGVDYHQVDSLMEEQVANLCAHLQKRESFSLVVSTIGVLHDGQELWPEKRLEDLAADQLTEYFQTNCIAPSLWLKHALPLLKSSQASHFVMFSARVGSISDNGLGGWYGYRASKAALNMMVKSAQVEYQRRAKNVTLVCYHPGTVNSELSRPFQANVAPQKLFSAEFSAQQLLGFLPGLGVDGAPHFIDWQGLPIPW